MSRAAGKKARCVGACRRGGIRPAINARRRTPQAVRSAALVVEQAVALGVAGEPRALVASLQRARLLGRYCGLVRWGRFSHSDGVFARRLISRGGVFALIEL